MKKFDILLLCGIVALAVIMLGIFAAVSLNKGDTVIITVDGEEYARLPLDEDTELTVETPYGKNVLVVADGEAYIREADCPDSTCVKTGKASELRSVVCLPHKLTVTIERQK